MVSTTLTIAVVLLSLLFMGDESGRLFRELDVKIGRAALIFAVVALIFTSMLSVGLLKAMRDTGWLFLRERAAPRRAGAGR